MKKLTLPPVLIFAITQNAEMRLEQLRQYSMKFETLLTEEAESIAEQAKEVGEKLLDLEGEDYMDEYEFDHWQVTTVFPEVLRNSLFVSLYSLLENYLNTLCGMFFRENDVAVELADLTGTGIFRAEAYLSKVVGMPFPTGPTWDKVLNFNRLRNTIVHAEGRVGPNSPKKLVNYVKHHPSLSVDSGHRLALGDEFVDDAISVIETVVDSIEAVLQSDHRDPNGL